MSLMLVVEDELSDVVLRHLVARTENQLAVARSIRAGGSGKIESRIKSYNSMARNSPCVVLLDLDRRDCAAGYVQRLLPSGLSRFMVVRIAVREVESWLLADAQGFSAYTGVAQSVIPVDPDTLPDAKDALVNIVRRSRNRSLKEAVLPKFEGMRQGPEYNAELSRFVMNDWDLDRAARRSASLERAIGAVNQLAGRLNDGSTNQ